MQSDKGNSELIDEVIAFSKAIYIKSKNLANCKRRINFKEISSTFGPIIYC
jgi:hypothetical protein